MRLVGACAASPYFPFRFYNCINAGYNEVGVKLTPWAFRGNGNYATIFFPLRYTDAALPRHPRCWGSGVLSARQIPFSRPFLRYRMASLDIPDRVIEGFTKIATLPEESYRELLSALETSP